MHRLTQLTDIAKDQWQNNRTRTVISISALVAIPTCFAFAKYWSRRALNKKLNEFEKESSRDNKIIVHCLAPAPDIPAPHLSPAVCKLVLFLEYAKVPYSIDGADFSTSTHPKTKKMPWITYKNEHIADSTLCMEFVCGKPEEFGVINLDKELTKEQKMVSIAFKNMLEDSLYYISGWRRYCLKENFPLYVDQMASGFQGFQRMLFAVIMRAMKSEFGKLFYALGLTRYEPEYVYRRGNEIIESVMEYMGDNKFFFGDQVSTIDFTIYGFLGNMYATSHFLTWNGSPELPAKLPYMDKLNDYLRRLEHECCGELKWKQ